MNFPTLKIMKCYFVLFYCMIFHTLISGFMPVLRQKIQVFDIWIYPYFGFRLRKRETGGDSFFILDRVPYK